MRGEIDVPEQAYPWLTEAVLDALRAVRGPHVAKKRYTVLKVAIARAMPELAEDAVWKPQDPEEQAQLCARSTWYGKWKHYPDIAAALDICEERLRDWRDIETLRIETEALQLRRRALAEGSVDAVNGLRKTALSTKDRADFRTEASRLLLVLADDDLARRLAHVDGGALPVKVTGTVMHDYGDMTDDELRAILSGQPGEGAGGEETSA